MRFRTMGNTGTVVSVQALGTMTFGAEADEATSGSIIEAYVAGGGNFLDTADVYSPGRVRADHRPLAGRAPDRRASSSSSRRRVGSRWGRARTTTAPPAGT